MILTHLLRIILTNFSRSSFDEGFIFDSFAFLQFWQKIMEMFKSMPNCHFLVLTLLIIRFWGEKNERLSIMGNRAFE